MYSATEPQDLWIAAAGFELAEPYVVCLTDINDDR